MVDVDTKFPATDCRPLDDATLNLPIHRPAQSCKRLIGDVFNQEKTLVGAFSVTVETSPINRLQL